MLSVLTSRVVGRCVLVSVLVSGLAWALVIPQLNRGESLYAYLVVLPIYGTILRPGRVLWELLEVYALHGSIAVIGMVSSTFITNATLGFLIGVVIHGVGGRHRPDTRSFAAPGSQTSSSDAPATEA